MPSFSQKTNNKRQFIIGVKVINAHASEEYRDDSVIQKLFKVTPIKALIDTGSSNSIIAEKYAEKLQLVPIGDRQIRTAQGITTVNQYKVDMAIPVTNIAFKEIKQKDGKKKTIPSIEHEYRTHIQHTVSNL